MIEISTIEVSGFKGAILGMRNPFKNRNKSDSCVYDLDSDGNPIWTIGHKDLELCQKLLRAGGDDDAKFMRMIHVQADVNAPLYWWKEFDTYKVATVANSESTMHTIAQREFTIDDFACDQLVSYDDVDEMDFEENEAVKIVPGICPSECEEYEENGTFETMPFYSKDILKATARFLNKLRKLYLEIKDKKYWYQMIQLLPSSYMQKRTVDLNYQTLRRIFFARRNHKLTEWSGETGFCGWIKTLPYAEELITYCIPSYMEFESKRKIFLGKASRLFAYMGFRSDIPIEEMKKLAEYTADLISADRSTDVLETIREKYDISALEKKYLKEDK